MRPLLLTLVTAALLAAAGCRPDPWEGVTPQEFARLEEYRLRGALLLEQGQIDSAADEFRKIQHRRPALALGYVNEAACFVDAPHRVQELQVVKKAQKAVELMPGSASPWLVHAQVGPPAAARHSLEEAVRREPAHLRALEMLARNLEDDRDAGHSARIAALRRRIRDLAPENLAAQVHWLRSAATQAAPAEVLATLDDIDRLLPRPDVDTGRYLQAARRAIRAGRPHHNTVRIVANLVLAEPLTRLAREQLVGRVDDRTRALLSDWDVPPPRFSGPLLRAPGVSWTEVTGQAGLAGVPARGTAPVGVGDLDLWARAGQYRYGEWLRMQDELQLVVGGVPERSLSITGRGFRAAPGAVAAGSPLVADLDNDFVPDVYVCREEGDFAWRNPLRGSNSWDYRLSRRGPPQGLRFPIHARGSGSAAAADLDQDGDLDIVRASSRRGEFAVRVLRNQGRWKFTDRTASSGLGLISGSATQVVCADFNGDHAVDVFVVRPAAGSRLFLNQRRFHFRNVSSQWGVPDLPGARAAAVADYNRDGRWDLAVAADGRDHATLLYRNTGAGFRPEGLSLPQSFRAEWVEWLDYDNDTWLDLALVGPDGLTLVRNEQGRLRTASLVHPSPGRWVTSLDYDQDGDLDLLTVGADDRLRLLRNEGGNALPWLRVELRGYTINPDNLEEDWESQGNNSYALGAALEVVGLWDQQKLLVNRPVMHVGLGRNVRVLGARVQWTHGSVQASLGIRPNTSYVIRHMPQGW